MSFCADTDNFRVVILHEPTARLATAMSTYAQLKRALGGERTTDLRIWQIDRATRTEFADHADRDIETADVIILAIRGGQPCPSAFARWKTGAGLGLGVPSGAVIVITDSAAEPTSATGTWTSMLEGITTKIHPGIYVWDPPEAGRETAPMPLVGGQVGCLAGADDAEFGANSGSAALSTAS